MPHRTSNIPDNNPDDNDDVLSDSGDELRPPPDLSPKQYDQSDSIILRGAQDWATWRGQTTAELRHGRKVMDNIQQMLREHLENDTKRFEMVEKRIVTEQTTRTTEQNAINARVDGVESSQTLVKGGGQFAMWLLAIALSIWAIVASAKP